MTNIVLQKESLLMVADKPSNLITFKSDVTIDAEPNSVVLINSDSHVINTETDKNFSVVHHTFLTYPDGGNGIEDAPYDYSSYVRKNGKWEVFDYVNYPVPQDDYLYEQVEILNDFKDTALGFGIDPDDRFVSLNDLVDLNIIKDDPSSGGGFVPVGPPVLSTPPIPSGLLVIGRWDSIDISWMPANFQYVNHGHVLVYRNNVNDFSTAGVIATVYGPSNYNDFEALVDTVYYYWIRFVSNTGVQGPFNSTDGTEGILSNDPDNLLDLLAGEITGTQLHSSLLEPIETIPQLTIDVINNANDIASESLTRANQIAAEGVARQQGLEAEAIARGTAIDEAVTILQTADMNLASEIKFITSTSNATFDTSELWQFDTDVEGWTSPGGVPVLSGGFIRPHFSTNSVLQSPAFTVDGAVYTDIRFRVKKVGAPVWTGMIQYSTTVSVGFFVSHQVSILEPEYFGGIATVSVDMLQSIDWDTSIITGLKLQLSLNSDASNYFELDWVGIGRSGPGASVAAIVETNTAWTTALAAEAEARLELTATVEDNIAYVDTQLTALTNNDITLASQIASLSAGNANQFDYGKIWYFDSTIESWVGFPSAPTIANPGWIRPADHASDSRIMSPAGLNIDAVKYTQVRLRVRRHGTPPWSGELFWRKPSDGAFAPPQVIAVVEPSWDSENTGLLTFNPPWSSLVTIDQIRIDLGNTQTSTNWLEIDWIAIGRPSPGASSADLQNLQTAMVTADTALANDITAANTAIAGKASQTALNTLQSQVTSIDGVVVSQGNSIVALNSQMNTDVINPNPNFINWSGTVPDGYTAWDLTGFSKYNGPYSYTGPNALRFNVTGSFNSGIVIDSISTLNNFSYLDVEIIFTLVSGVFNGCGVIIDWINTASTVYRTYAALINSGITASTVLGKKSITKMRVSRPAGFTGSFSHYRIYILGNYPDALLGGSGVKDIIIDRVAITASDISASAISNLETRVTSTETTNTTQATQITNLNASLGGKAEASAVTALDARVTTVEGVNTSQASDITTLKATSPGSGNLIPTDTEFMVNTSGWLAWSQFGIPFTFARDIAAPDYAPQGIHTLGMHPNVASPTGVFDMYYSSIPVAVGKRYCFVAYTSNYRCEARALMVFLNASGTSIHEVQEIIPTATGMTQLSDWARYPIFGVAPPGAKTVIVALRLVPIAGQTDPYLWFVRPMLCEVLATTTAAPLYSAGGTAGSYAAIQTEASVRASETGPLMAQWSVKTTVGSLVGGVGFYNDGVKTRFMIHADQFSVYSPGSQSFGMIIEGSKVVMDGAFIKSASIDSASINNLNVNKLTGDSATFVKLNVGTLVVDDIQGNISDVFSVTNTAAFNFGGTGSSYSASAGNQISVAWINVPGRLYDRPYGMQFYVQGSATKSVAGPATIVAEFFTPNPSQSALSTLGSPSDCYYTDNYIQRVIGYSTGQTPSNPSNWDTVNVGDAISMYINDSNVHEGIVTNIVVVNNPTGPGAFVAGKVFILANMVKLGNIPSNLAGVTMTRRTAAGRYYNKLGITMATYVNTASSNQQFMFNLNFYDISGKLTTAKTLLATIGCYTSYTTQCINNSITFAVLAGR
jgi:hypothetical protein